MATSQISPSRPAAAASIGLLTKQNHIERDPLWICMREVPQHHAGKRGKVTLQRLVHLIDLPPEVCHLNGVTQAAWAPQKVLDRRNIEAVVASSPRRQPIRGLTPPCCWIIPTAAAYSASTTSCNPSNPSNNRLPPAGKLDLLQRATCGLSSASYKRTKNGCRPACMIVCNADQPGLEGRKGECVEALVRWDREDL